MTYGASFESPSARVTESCPLTRSFSTVPPAFATRSRSSGTEALWTSEAKARRLPRLRSMRLSPATAM